MADTPAPIDTDATKRRRRFPCIPLAVVLVLVVVGVVIGVRHVSDRESRIIGDAFQVQVVLEDSVSPNERADIERRLEALSGNDAKYVSKREASRRAKALFKESPGIVENIHGNPFPASI